MLRLRETYISQSERCQIYIAGVHDASKGFESYGDYSDTFKFCKPIAVDAVQLS